MFQTTNQQCVFSFFLAKTFVCFMWLILDTLHTESVCCWVVICPHWDVKTNTFDSYPAHTRFTAWDSKLMFSWKIIWNPFTHHKLVWNRAQNHHESTIWLLFLKPSLGSTNKNTSPGNKKTTTYTWHCWIP